MPWRLEQDPRVLVLLGGELGEVHVRYVKDESFEWEVGAARFDDECDSFEDALRGREKDYLAIIFRDIERRILTDPLHLPRNALQQPRDIPLDQRMPILPYGHAVHLPLGERFPRVDAAQVEDVVEGHFDWKRRRLDLCARSEEGLTEVCHGFDHL